MHLRLEIERHLRAHPEVKPAHLGRAIANDPGFIADLRKGRELRPATEARIVERFRAYLNKEGQA